MGDLERALAGGRVPSAMLQDAFYRTGTLHAHDLVSIAVHTSFFVVPSLVGIVLLLSSRQQFTRYWLATTLTLLIASAGFFLLPTAPPWMQEGGEVHRVVVEQASGRGVALGSAGATAGTGAQQLGFDPNSLAAMPSVHVAAAVLVCFACWQGRPTFRLLGIAYALVMSVSVVYLGEHYALDVLGGWLVAAIGWWLTRPIVSRSSFLSPNRQKG